MRRRLHADFFASPSAADTDLDCSPGSHCAPLAHAVEGREREARAPTHGTHRTARLLRAHARTKATLPALGYEYSAEARAERAEAKVAALGGGVFPPYVVDGERKAPMGP